MITPTYSGADSLRARGMGVQVDCPKRCLMCEAHEVRDVQQRDEIADCEALAWYLSAECGKSDAAVKGWEVVATEWKHRFYLALFAFGLVFGFAVYQGGVR